MLFDAHIHKKHNEQGGFLIALDGNSLSEETLNNSEVLKYHNPSEKYFSFYYVCMKDIKNTIQHPYLKYHPRREGYTSSEVLESIKKNKPHVVIIDTLNEPSWNAYDYWKIAKENEEVQFIMAHSGGYLINDFVKICHFQSNVWLDFSCTQDLLGKFGNGNGLAYVNDAIKYSLNSSFNNRILCASDYPFYEQDEVFRFYDKYSELLDSNFVRLSGIIS